VGLVGRRAEAKAPLLEILVAMAALLSLGGQLTTERRRTSRGVRRVGKLSVGIGKQSTPLGKISEILPATWGVTEIE
jgi:hypothetical protein